MCFQAICEQAKDDYLVENIWMISKRRLLVQTLKMAWSKRFIPNLFVWHSSRDIVRMKWRYFRTGLYTKKKKSHWLK